MRSAKLHVINLVKNLPDDATYDDIVYEIQLHKNIDEGIEQIERGEYLTSEEAMERLKKCNTIPAFNER